jgi:tRNA (guanosine-2'-O-)-methyltransferase
MRGTLIRRQPDLAVVFENIEDDHNVSAMLRSCDAVGAATAHLVYSIEERPEISKGVAASAQRWLDLCSYDSIEACYATLREAGFTIYATSLTHEAHELYDLDLTGPTAFVFGNESRGVSEAAVEGADGVVYIPMMGMVESLNVSVACSVALYEALRQRRAAGMYGTPSWPAEEADLRLRAWLEREGRDPDAVNAPMPDEIPRPRNRYEYRGH